MITIISPAKSLDHKRDLELSSNEASKVRFFKDSLELIDLLKEKSSVDLMEMMDISKELADLNVQRYQSFKKRQLRSNSFRAGSYFSGGVYQGLMFHDWNEQNIQYGQSHLRILSGLYGLLRPLDLIQPYRLEMGSKLSNSKGKNLYEFWGEKITQQLKSDFRGHSEKVLINLASQEYFKAIRPKLLKYSIININFKEQRGDQLKFISFNAKKARGLMARYIMENKIEKVEDLKAFDVENYIFSEEHSTDKEFLFIKN